MRRLYRSHTNRILAGVCGGLGKYFNLDPVLIRLIWLILILFGGIGLVLYVIGWLIIPAEEDATAEGGETPPRPRTGKGRFWWGMLLIIMGVFLWGSKYTFIYWPIIPGVHIHSRDLVPFALVLVGIYILYVFGRHTRTERATGGKWLYRSRTDRKVAGVCGGIAEYYNVDPTLVRVLWVGGAFFYLASVLLYLVLMVVLPEKELETDE